MLFHLPATLVAVRSAEEVRVPLQPVVSVPLMARAIAGRYRAVSSMKTALPLATHRVLSSLSMPAPISIRRTPLITGGHGRTVDGLLLLRLLLQPVPGMVREVAPQLLAPQELVVSPLPAPTLC